MIKHRPLTATMLRMILSISLFVITLLAVGALSFLNGAMESFASEVSHASVDANASQDNIQTLQRVQQQLADDKDVVDRASSIVADSQSYQYQNQILTDLNNYANKAGITITNLDFAAAASTGKPNTAAPAPSGVKSTSVSVTLKNPVVYNNLLRFIKSIEQNLTKMQISKIGLAKGTGNDITSEVLTIEVYIK